MKIQTLGKKSKKGGWEQDKKGVRKEEISDRKERKLRREDRANSEIGGKKW